MGITFTPLSTLSLMTIPREKMATASAITNTIRQISGSIGVAFFTTLLTSRVNFHAQIFANAVQSGSQEFRNVMAGMAYHMQAAGGSTLSTAVKQSQSLLASHLAKQAYIQGVDDDFLVAGIITLIGLIPTIILKTRKKSENQNVQTYESK